MSESSTNTRGTGESTRFLNVDLELKSRRPLDVMLSHWADSVIVLRNSVDHGMHTVWLELDQECISPAPCIAAFMELIEALPGMLKETWRECEDRCFNVGIQGGLQPPSLEFSLPAQLLSRVASANVRLAVTVYSTAIDP